MTQGKLFKIHDFIKLFCAKLLLCGGEAARAHVCASVLSRGIAQWHADATTLCFRLHISLFMILAGGGCELCSLHLHTHRDTLPLHPLSSLQRNLSSSPSFGIVWYRIVKAPTIPSELHQRVVPVVTSMITSRCRYNHNYTLSQLITYHNHVL